MQVQVHREGADRLGWSWRRTEPKLLRASGELLLYCQSNASTGMQGGGRQVGVDFEEDRAQAAESIRRITATLSVKCKYRYTGRGQTGGGGVGGGQSPGCWEYQENYCYTVSQMQIQVQGGGRQVGCWGWGGGVEEDKAQAAESIPRITATLSVKRKLVQVHRKGAGRWGDGGGGGQSPGCWEYQENYCYTVSQTQVQVRRERAGRWGWSWRRTSSLGSVLLHPHLPTCLPPSCVPVQVCVWLIV